MPRIGYHASHEQFPPGDLLRYVRLAESAGFQSAMCSDHFAPWSSRQGHSGYAWAWLGAALATTSLPFVPFTTTASAALSPTVPPSVPPKSTLI